jgi:trk/ktr system potassium uptake protein
MGVLLFPFLQIGGMQFYRMESSVQSDKPVARFAEFSRALVLIYIVITLANIIAYMFAGMNLFDAVNHAMTTISTGGYSTHDKSMAYFGPAARMVAIVFMTIGALPFVVFLRALAAKSIRQVYDPQIGGLLVIFAGLSALLIASAMMFPKDSFGGVALDAVFSVVSIVTTTGYVSVDYSHWGALAVAVIFVGTFLGGAAGSTAGGLKTYRLMILLETVKTTLKELVYPHGVFVVRYDGRKMSERALRSVAVFTALYLFILMAMTLLLAATGLDLTTSLTGSLTALTNTGPGLGAIVGPVGNFASLSDPAKWVLSVGMLAGRLELMTVLVLFAPAFWRT